MRKNNNKQRKSMLLSTAIVVAGCLVTGLYANRSINQVEDYTVDLSQLGSREEADGTLVSDAGAARANGTDVVNPAMEKVEQETADDRKPEPETADDRKPEPETADGEEPEPETADDRKPEPETTDDKKAETTVATLSFLPEDGMTWPVRGDVILNYSMDSAVYFSTLEQYKYNPAIYIDARRGDNVSACAKGRVSKIGKDNEIGSFVTLDLGNGYEVICGQLENISVKEGDVVSRGQVIGTVAGTTKYYAVEGDHVYLKITKDGKPVNPLELLQ